MRCACSACSACAGWRSSETRRRFCLSGLAVVFRRGGASRRGDFAGKQSRGEAAASGLNLLVYEALSSGWLS